jgi:hypothetical protein
VRYHSHCCLRSFVATVFPLLVLLQLLLQGHTLVFTGHSKGAAVAGIAATELLLKAQADAERCASLGFAAAALARNILYVGFGAPPYADPDTIERQRTKSMRGYENNFVHFVNGDDPVPQVGVHVACGVVVASSSGFKASSEETPGQLNTQQQQDPSAFTIAAARAHCRSQQLSFCCCAQSFNGLLSSSWQPKRHESFFVGVCNRAFAGI